MERMGPTTEKEKERERKRKKKRRKSRRSNTLREVYSTSAKRRDIDMQLDTCTYTSA